MFTVLRGFCLFMWLLAASHQTTGQIFVNILPEMYLRTRKSPLTFGSQLDLDPDLRIFEELFFHRGIHLRDQLPWRCTVFALWMLLFLSLLLFLFTRITFLYLLISALHNVFSRSFCVWLSVPDYQCKWSTGKNRVWNDLQRVDGDVKPYSLIHSSYAIAVSRVWSVLHGQHFFGHYGHTLF